MPKNKNRNLEEDMAYQHLLTSIEENPTKGRNIRVNLSPKESKNYCKSYKFESGSCCWLDSDRRDGRVILLYCYNPKSRKREFL